MANDYFLDILNPKDPSGPKIQATIPYRLIIKFYKFHPVRYENFRVARHVLLHPLRVFEGVRQFNDGGWCFTGRPKTWHIKESVECEFPQDLIYAVYLNPRFFVYEFRAEHSAEDDPDCPDDWKNRYKALIWKNIS